MLSMLFLAVVLASCEHDIDFDYPSTSPLVVIEGRVSNDGVYVRVSRTRDMSDSVTTHVLDNAQVTISSDDGVNEVLIYDFNAKTYQSPSGLVGVPGHAYTLHVIVDGNSYEATSVMPAPSPIDTVYFHWTDVLSERLYSLSLTSQAPYPGQVGYYWYRLHRGNEVFRWGAATDRGCSPGKLERDIICSSDLEMREEEDSFGKIPLKDGDILQLELLTIDRATYDYLMSLTSSARTTTNPISNLSGGALGFFTAVGRTMSEPLVFDRNTMISNP